MRSWITVDASVDVDIDDVLSNMNSRELQELADELYDDGYIPKQLEKVVEPDDDFSIACRKLMGESWRLSREEEQFIINISKRF